MRGPVSPSPSTPSDDEGARAERNGVVAGSLLGVPQACRSSAAGGHGVRILRDELSKGDAGIIKGGYHLATTDGALLYKDGIVIPNKGTLRDELLHAYYDDPRAGLRDIDLQSVDSNTGDFPSGLKVSHPGACLICTPWQGRLNTPLLTGETERHFARSCQIRPLTQASVRLAPTRVRSVSAGCVTSIVGLGAQAAATRESGVGRQGRAIICGVVHMWGCLIRKFRGAVFLPNRENAPLVVGCRCRCVSRSCRRVNPGRRPASGRSSRFHTQDTAAWMGEI